MSISLSLILHACSRTGLIHKSLGLWIVFLGFGVYGELHAQNTQPSTPTTALTSKQPDITTKPAATQPVSKGLESLQHDPNENYGILAAFSRGDLLWAIDTQDEKSRLWIYRFGEEDARLQILYELKMKPVRMVALSNGLVIKDDQGSLWIIRENTDRQLITDPPFIEPEQLRLPLEGVTLLDFSAWNGQLIILLRMSNHPILGYAALYEYGPGGWRHITPPQNQLYDTAARLVQTRDDEAELMLLAQDNDQLMSYRYGEDSQWRSRSVGQGDISAARWYRFDGNLTGLQRDAGQFQIDMWRHDQWWLLKGSVPDDVTAWTVVLRGDQLALVGIPVPEDNDHAVEGLTLVVTGVDPMTAQLGTTAKLLPIRPDPLKGIDPMLIAIVIGLVLSVISSARIWLGRSTLAAIRLPEGVLPAPLFKRMGAGVLDMLPGLLIAMLVFRLESPGELLTNHWPVKGVSSWDMFPGITALAVYALSCMISEFIFGTTLGKRLMGMRVLMMDGRKPTVIAVMIRNLFKPLELIGMPLLLMPFFTSARQRLGDFTARTLVVHEVKIDPESEKTPKE